MPIPWASCQILTIVGSADPRLWEKCSRHSRRMRKPQFYVSGKRPMAADALALPIARSPAAVVAYWVFRYKGPLLPRGRTSTNCILSLWREIMENARSFYVSLKPIGHMSRIRPFRHTTDSVRTVLHISALARDLTPQWTSYVTGSWSTRSAHIARSQDTRRRDHGL